MFLEFEIDSRNIIVNPKKEKVDKVVYHIKHFRDKVLQTVLDLVYIIGLLVSLFPGFQHGLLFYRYLETDKIKAFTVNRRVSVSKEALERSTLVGLKSI